MEITGALIERFLNNDCDEQEQQAVKAYFIGHPEVLKKYMTERSWQAFDTDKPLEEPVSEKMLAVIRQQTYRSRKVMMTRWWYAAAAVMVLSLSTCWYFHFQTATPEKVMATKTTIQPEPITGFRHSSNTTAKPVTITLEDGTKVKLAPQSELTYPVPFGKDRRYCSLKGQALFTVAKDTLRPFTVHAGNLATTAIGTVFRITAFDGQTTCVHLLSGKVRVQADSNVQLKGMSTTYLLPGQELQLDVQQHLLFLNRKENNKAHKPAPIVTRHSSAQTDSTVTIFRNEPIEKILIALSEKHQTQILFRPEQVEGMTFTGQYDAKKETLAAFMQTISLLNNLVMREENGSIIIESQ